MSLETTRSDLPEILCTGFSQDVNVENAAELGITEFLFKPLTRESLALAIRNGLDRNHAEGEQA